MIDRPVVNTNALGANSDHDGFASAGDFLLLSRLRSTSGTGCGDDTPVQRVNPHSTAAVAARITEDIITMLRTPNAVSSTKPVRNVPKMLPTVFHAPMFPNADPVRVDCSIAQRATGGWIVPKTTAGGRKTRVTRVTMRKKRGNSASSSRPPTRSLVTRTLRHSRAASPVKYGSVSKGARRSDNRPPQ